jgi:hypothetical protein
MNRRHSGLGLPPLVLAGLLLAQLVSAAPLPKPAVAPSGDAGLDETTGAGTSVGGDSLQVHDV